MSDPTARLVEAAKEVLRQLPEVTAHGIGEMREALRAHEQQGPCETEHLRDEVRFLRNANNSLGSMFWRYTNLIGHLQRKLTGNRKHIKRLREQSQQGGDRLQGRVAEIRQKFYATIDNNNSYADLSTEAHYDIVWLCDQLQAHTPAPAPGKPHDDKCWFHGDEPLPPENVFMRNCLLFYRCLEEFDGDEAKAQEEYRRILKPAPAVAQEPPRCAAEDAAPLRGGYVIKEEAATPREAAPVKKGGPDLLAPYRRDMNPFEVSDKIAAEDDREAAPLPTTTTRHPWEDGGAAEPREDAGKEWFSVPQWAVDMVREAEQPAAERPPEKHDMSVSDHRITYLWGKQWRDYALGLARKLADPPRWRQGCTHDTAGVPQILGRCPRCIREMEYYIVDLEAKLEAAKAYAKHERSLGAEGPSIKLQGALQENEVLEAKLRTLDESFAAYIRGERKVQANLEAKLRGLDVAFAEYIVLARKQLSDAEAKQKGKE